MRMVLGCCRREQARASFEKRWDPGRVRRHLRVQHLDGDDAIDRDLAGLVDHAHATLADARQDLVATVEGLAD
jgi:hypothetical protein